MYVCYVCMYVNISYWSWFSLMSADMYVCMLYDIYVCIDMYVCMYVCYVCMYVNISYWSWFSLMSADMYVCMYEVNPPILC